MTSTPMAFISHAGTDKAQFGLPLAAALMAIGIETWIDEWELVAGDSLVQKIFHSGIKEADAVVVLLSENSLSRAWVEKELTVSVVESVNKRCKLIPVRLDQSPVPTVLQDLVWIDWGRRTAHEVADQVGRAMYGITDKPPLGIQPAYTKPSLKIAGLAPQDTVVLEILLEAHLLETGELLQMDVIGPLAADRGVSVEVLRESVEILEAKGFLYDEDTSIMRAGFIVRMNHGQVMSLCEARGMDVVSVTKSIVARVCNEEASTLLMLAEQLPHIPQNLILSIIKVLAGNKFWTVEGAGPGDEFIFDVKATARRWLMENS